MGLAGGLWWAIRSDTDTWSGNLSFTMEGLKVAKTKTKKKVVKRKAPTKDCPKCGTKNAAAARTCKKQGCGHQFLIKKKKKKAKAKAPATATDSDLTMVLATRLIGVVGTAVKAREMIDRVERLMNV